MFKIAIILILSSVSMLANTDCIECHKEQKKQCASSKHFTLENSINITRKAWGIIDSNVTLQTIPQPPKSISKPSDLVDDFLRRKCLKCHLGLKGSGEDGMNRQRNCLACHSPHSSEEKCQVKKISSNKCLACHNKSFVGADYLGLFPKDHHQSFRGPLAADGKYPPQKYGIDHHHLSTDIHFDLGMSCVDCHNNKNSTDKWENTAKCTDCHKTPTTTNHPDYHNAIDCSACHSAWNMSSYELSVFRDDTADYEKWKELTLQEDSYLTNFLSKALKSKRDIAPRMPDWIDKKLKKGIWYSGWRYRRWEDFTLGNSDDGSIKILRPIFQYHISYRDASGRMILDDVSDIAGKSIEAWTPYSPHTIAKRAKSCEQCHENSLMFGLDSSNTILNLKKPNNIMHGSPLNSLQLKRLKSKRYKQIRAKAWKK